MQVNIKIDDELYRKLKERAREERRTITAELNILLTNMLVNNIEEPKKLYRNIVD